MLLLTLAPASAAAQAAPLDDVDVSGRDGRNLRALVALFASPAGTLPGALGEVRNRLDGLTTGQRRRLLRDLLPELARQRALRQHPGSLARHGPNRRRSDARGAGPRRPDRFAGGSVLGLSAVDPSPLTTVWVQTTRDSAEQNDRDGVEGFDSDADGVMLGLDREVRPGFVLGIAGGRTSADVTSNTESRGRDDTDADDYVAYSNLVRGRHRIDVVVSLRDSRTDRLRRVVLPGPAARVAELSSDIDSEELLLSASWGYDVPLEGNWYLTPELSLSRLEVSTDDYVESGGGELGLTVETDDESQLEAGVGISAGYFGQRGAWTLSPGGFVRLDRVLDADETVTRSTFAGTRFGFTSRGYSVADTRIGIGLSLSAYHTNGFGAGIAVTHQRQDDYRYTAATLSLELTF